MSPRYLAFALSMVVFAGCSAPNNYDSTNPFDEPSTRRITPQATAVSHAPLLVPGPEREVATAMTAVATTANASPGAAIPFAVEPGMAIVVGPAESSEPTAAAEMVNEANRLGSLGDSQGKASLLEQAGYSGSPKAFYTLARMYSDGSLPVDVSQVFKYVSLAHQGGYVDATRALGLLYLRGQGTPADEQYGRGLLELASKSSPRAAREYGLLLTNQLAPHLNDPERGIEYIREAASKGDSEAVQALAKVLATTGDASGTNQHSQQYAPGDTEPQEATPASSVKDRALHGDPNAMYEYAQQISLRRLRVDEPEFTAYCWLAAAAQLGSKKAADELVFVKGVKSISDRKQPGRLDQCIRDLHYQVSGEN